jgi:hypothetical protein
VSAPPVVRDRVPATGRARAGLATLVVNSPAWLRTMWFGKSLEFPKPPKKFAAVSSPSISLELRLIMQTQTSTADPRSLAKNPTG